MTLRLLTFSAAMLLGCNGCHQADRAAPPAGSAPAASGTSTATGTASAASSGSAGAASGTSAGSVGTASAGSVASASASSAGSASPTIGSAPAAGETTIRVEDDGKTFDVAAGSTVTFKLAGNAGTGFMWKPNGVNTAVLAQQGSVTHVTSGSTPGAANEDVYHFRAVAPGSSTVEMDYARPWEHGPAGKAIHVTVNVH